ncbi:MAG: phosphate ABC transporter substrate-binding protein [Desulfobacterales bacterium]|nr:phosphate ABC transporter substrate-binding protein [Desulfobacterales bacterium]
MVVTGGGSGNGIKDIIDGKIDIANSSRFIKGKEIGYSFEKNVYIVPFRIAIDCIIPVVHPDNPVTNLSLDNLKKMFTGEITNWKDIGWNDQPIVLVSRDTSSGTYEIWESKVMKNEDVFPGAMVQLSNAEVLKTVSATINAIGYIGIGYLSSEVKPLRVDNVMGNKDNALKGNYAISRPLFMLTRGWPEEITLDFISYILDPEKGQKTVQYLGFVPLYEAACPKLHLPENAKEQDLGCQYPSSL